jgi:hypothetical protein
MNDKPNTPPIVAALDKAAPLLIGGVILYAFFNKKRDKLQDAIMYGGIASQLYKFIELAKPDNKKK